MRAVVKSSSRPVRRAARGSISADAALERVARGRPVTLAAAKGLSVLAVETASQATLSKLAARGDAMLLLTHARARTLKIRLYTPDAVALPLPRKARIEELRAIADPTADLDFPLKGPFAARREKLPMGSAAALKLAKLAGLLPAVVVRRGASGGAIELSPKDVETFDEETVRTLKIVARARVPLEGAERSELIAFRSGEGGPEHYAIMIGAPARDRAVLTRLHSECFTGDLLGSLKCDCGSQLRGAVKALARAGGGVLLYLAQEGRGIGLINKLRAYRLQDQGFDTMEANERLGFEADERLYGIAAKMLSLLGYRSVKLLTNNPDKVAALRKAGVTVAARMRHAFPQNAHNRAYLKTKAEKGGHLF